MQLGNLPLDLPFELCEIIFGYLDSRDLLNCCLVCKSWLEFFNKSSVCKKVTLLIDDTRQLEDIAKCTRRYLKIKLNKLDSEMIIKVLGYYELTIEQLDIENCQVDQECDMRFVNLKCLTISSCCADIISKVFKHPCDSLKCLVLYRLYGPSSSHVLRFLQFNDTLEEVNFYLDEMCNVFSHSDVTVDIKFRLKSLFISYKSSCDLPTRTLTNIEKFLKSQGDTLETISLVNSANIKLLLSIWNDLKVVERLYCFSSDPNFDLKRTDFPLAELLPKPTLNDLELHTLGPFSIKIDHFIPFLISAVRLRALGVWNLKRELVEYVARNCHDLRSLSCATVENGCVTFYSELKSKIGTNDKIDIHQYL